MARPRLQLYYDFVDPVSWLVARDVRAVSGLGDAEIGWHPFELRPPPAPLVTVDDPTLAPRWEEARRLVADASATGRRTEDGEAVDSAAPFFAPPTLVPWTRKAHELVLHASEHDRADAVRARVFEAYLLEGADIGRVDVLVSLGTELGLDRTETKAVLDVDRHEAEVGTLRADALAAGISEPPTLVVGDERLEGFHNRDRIGTLLGT